MELELLENHGLKSLLAKADIDPMMTPMIQSAILAVGTAIESYKDNQHGLVQSEAERLNCAVSEGCRHFLLLAATHGLG